jgi:hypothetical protein
MRTFILLALTAACGSGSALDCSVTFAGYPGSSSTCPTMSALYDASSDTSTFDIELSADTTIGGATVRVDVTGQLEATTYDSTNTQSAIASAEGGTLAAHWEGTPVVTIKTLGAPIVKGNITSWPQIHGAFSAHLIGLTDDLSGTF